MTQTAHPNRRKIEGVLTRLDQPSDKAPEGSRGHRVIITTAAAEEALETLIGMPVGFGNCWTIHNYRQRCGVVTSAKIEGNELRVCMDLWVQDFPEVEEIIAQGKLGMSYELDHAHVVNMTSPVWTIHRVTFRGAAILLADKAAYSSTRVWLAAGASEEEYRIEVSGEIVLLNVVEG